MKSAERLAFEEDRLRMRLEGRIVMKRILNVLEDELEVVHQNANARGVIPRVTLETGDLGALETAARRLVGTLGFDELDPGDRA